MARTVAVVGLAALAVDLYRSSLPAEPAVLVADRPFLFVHDVATGAPLFLGRVTDPR